MTEHDDRLDRAVELLREPVSLRTDLEQRIMAEVAAGPAPRARTGSLWAALDWMRRRDPSRPYLLRVSFNAPHTPVVTPAPFDTLIQADAIQW